MKVAFLNYICSSNAHRFSNLDAGRSESEQEKKKRNEKQDGISSIVNPNFQLTLWTSLVRLNEVLGQ